jgi:hypothetical protein
VTNQTINITNQLVVRFSLKVLYFVFTEIMTRTVVDNNYTPDSLSKSYTLVMRTNTKETKPLNLIHQILLKVLYSQSPNISHVQNNELNETQILPQSPILILTDTYSIMYRLTYLLDSRFSLKVLYSS